METNLVMCDTNVFIHWFNGDLETMNRLHKIGIQNVALSVVSVMELIQGVDNKEQLAKLKKRIKHYTRFHLTKDVSERALLYIENYKLSHNLQIPDAIIGATSAVFKIPLYTYNIKDFNYLPDVKLI